MKIGIPREIKPGERRVGATVEMVAALVQAGHQVSVERDAGAGIHRSDADYRAAGAEVVEEVWAAEMVLKVKEPQPEEVERMWKGQVLFCFLHLAANRELLERLVEKEVVAFGFEMVTGEAGELPLLTPMSEIAGRFALQQGALLVAEHKGILLGGVPGVDGGRVCVVGAGVVGTGAARVAMALGAQVTLLDRNLERLRELDELFDGKLQTQFSTEEAVAEAVQEADLVVGAVLVPGGRAPKIVTREMVERMERGSVLIDVAVDQGGCCETSRVTSWDAPTFVESGVVHYGVANIPGQCPKTATYALGNATLPFVLELAERGWRKAVEGNPHLERGLNVSEGEVCHEILLA